MLDLNTKLKLIAVSKIHTLNFKAITHFNIGKIRVYGTLKSVV